MQQAINNQTYFNKVKTPKWEFPPIVIAWQFSSADNLGALLRVCDNFGVKEVYFVGEKENYKVARIKRNATTAFHKVNFHFVSVEDVWSKIPKEYLKIAVDTTSSSIALTNYKFNEPQQLNKSFCFVFGNETIGLENSVISKCDDAIHIPMIGETYSMNVVQAAAVVLFECVRQCLRFD